MRSLHGFSSDNASGVHPRILTAIERANRGPTLAYGDDPHTRSAIARLREHFDGACEVLFVFGGTAANVIGLRTAVDSYHSVLCSDVAHVWLDECGAPEHFLGCKLIPVPTDSGKLTPEALAPLLGDRDVVHRSQPRAITISQPTEWGTVYRPGELETLARFAHEQRLVLHMDGARLANAAASLGTSLAEISCGVGVDVLSLGGTKNGLLAGEAVLVFDPELVKSAHFHRKQAMQLASKMRFLAAQFEALLGDDLWLENARHANSTATRLVQELRSLPQLEIVQPVETNAVFVRLAREHAAALERTYGLFPWDRSGTLVRLMTSFATEERDIATLVSALREIIAVEGS